MASIVQKKKQEREVHLKRQAQLQEKRKAVAEKIQKEDRLRDNN